MWPFVLILLSLLTDITYPLRIIYLLIARALGKGFKVRDSPWDVSRLNSLVLPQDLDTNMHMNNARYVRELDFARMDFWISTGLFKLRSTRGIKVVLGAISIRYRREMFLFQRFHVETRLLGWDDQNSFYLEQKFVDSKTKFVHAIALCKQTIVKTKVSEVAKEFEWGESPKLGPEVVSWIESNNHSSNALNPNKNK